MTSDKLDISTLKEESTLVYNAFIKYDFKREAQTLTIDGKPTIGSYIAILDKLKGKKGQPHHKSAYQTAKKHVLNHVELLASENIQGANALKTDLEGILQD